MDIEKPFWTIEFNYLKELDKVARRCEKVTNLREALDTGLNSIYLHIDGNTCDYVGYKDEDGEYVLTLPYRQWEDEERDGVDVTYCHFLYLEKDDDGYTQGHFQIERPYDAD